MELFNWQLKQTMSENKTHDLSSTNTQTEKEREERESKIEMEGERDWVNKREMDGSDVFSSSYKEEDWFNAYWIWTHSYYLIEL